MNSLLNIVELPQEKNILEIGAADENFTKNLFLACKEKNNTLTVLHAQNTNTAILREMHLIPANDSYLMHFSDNSFSCIYINRLLETLRMDQLYMIFSEARRILEGGGTFAIANGTRSKKSWKNFILEKLQNKNIRELHHYFSPEDWEEITYLRNEKYFQPTEFLLLRKLSDK